MNILHLISSAGLFGAEGVVLNLAANFPAGHKVIIGALNNRHNPHLEIIDEARRLGLPTVVFDSAGRLDLRAIRQVRRFIEDNEVDILHTHNYKSNFMGLLAAKLSGVPIVATVYGFTAATPNTAFAGKQIGCFSGLLINREL